MTTIHHDPIFAAEAARRRFLESKEDATDRAKRSIEQTTKVEVYFEEAGSADNPYVHERSQGVKMSDASRMVE